VVPELVDMLSVGRGYDRFRMSLYEAAALGTNMSVPYGAWMGSVVEDAFYPPHDLCVEIQQFLADHERLYSRRTWNETAVVYSVESNFYGGARPEEIANNTANLSGGGTTPFWAACEALADAAQPYDVVFFPEGELRPDTVTVDDLAQYRTIVLPGVHHLTEQQAEALIGFLDRGGTVLAQGEVGSNRQEALRERIAGHENVRLIADAAAVAADAATRQVSLATESDIAVNLMRVEDGVAIHLIRYDYCEEEDRVPALDELTLTVRLPEAFEQLECHDPAGRMTGCLERDGETHRVTLRNVPLYGIVHLTRGE
jgi:hypothetical protein